MRKIFLGLLFVLIFVLLACLINLFLLGGLRSSKNSHYAFWNTIIRGDIDAEILIVGSSRAMVQFDCSLIEESTKKTCFNLGVGGAMVHIQLPLLRLYLNYNEKPEYVIIALGQTELTHPKLADASQYVPYLNEPYLYQALLRDDPAFMWHKFIPLYSFSTFGTDILKYSIYGLMGLTDNSNERIKGFVGLDGRARVDEMKYLAERFPNGELLVVDKRSLKDLEDMVRLIQNSGAKAVFVLPPTDAEASKFFPNLKDVLRLFHTIAEKYEITCFDYSQDALTKEKEHYYNSQHLNKDGAEVFTRLFLEDFNNYLEQ